MYRPDVIIACLLLWCELSGYGDISLVVQYARAGVADDLQLLDKVLLAW